MGAMSRLVFHAVCASTPQMILIDSNDIKQASERNSWMVRGSIGSVSLAGSKVAGCARRISFLSLEAKPMNLTSCSKATGGYPMKRGVVKDLTIHSLWMASARDSMYLPSANLYPSSSLNTVLLYDCNYRWFCRFSLELRLWLMSHVHDSWRTTQPSRNWLGSRLSFPTSLLVACPS